MKKMVLSIPIFIIIIAMLLCATPLFYSSALSFDLTIGKAYVITSRCDIYESADFASEKLEISLKHGEQVEIQNFEGDFAHISYNDDTEGYVYKFYLSQNESQDVYPITNAKLRRDTKIYDLNLQESGFVAKKNSRIYIYGGFDNKKEYTAVQVVLEDGKLFNGYIKTEDINPDGVSGLLIAGITIIVASVTIILSLIFIKKKKGQTKKVKNS